MNISRNVTPLGFFSGKLCRNLLDICEFPGISWGRIVPSILTPERRAEVPRGLEELCFMDPIPNWEVQLPLPTLLSSEESPSSSLRSLNAWSRAKGSARGLHRQFASAGLAK